MWHSLIAEIEKEKGLWAMICVPLLLAIPFFLLQGSALLPFELPPETLDKLTKGFSIIVSILFVRTFLDKAFSFRSVRFQMRLPISHFQLGFIRIAKTIALWLVWSLLAIINIYLYHPQNVQTIVPNLCLGFGCFMILFGIFLILSDLISFLPFINQQLYILLSVIMTAIPFFVFFSFKSFFQTASNLSTIFYINLLGLLLLTLSIYTFTRLKSYFIFRPTT